MWESKNQVIELTAAQAQLQQDCDQLKQELATTNGSLAEANMKVWTLVLTTLAIGRL
jgi:outer membrane murein-binding lipoprotein Lpp